MDELGPIEEGVDWRGRVTPEMRLGNANDMWAQLYLIISLPFLSPIFNSRRLQFRLFLITQFQIHID